MNVSLSFKSSDQIHRPITLRLVDCIAQTKAKFALSPTPPSPLRAAHSQDIYQACRGRTIGVFQHVTENDFIINLLGGSILQLESAYQSTYGRARGRRRLDSDDREGNNDGAREDTDHAASASNNNVRREQDTTNCAPREQVGGASGSSAMTSARRRLPAEFTYDDYDNTVNAGTDAFFASVATIAFESSLPATIRVVSEGYLSTDDDGMELTVASEDLAGLFERNDVASILRGAVLSPAQAVSAHFTAALSNLSPAFNIPAGAVQRGRDHGLPTYNAAREARHFVCIQDVAYDHLLMPECSSRGGSKCAVSERPAHLPRKGKTSFAPLAMTVLGTLTQYHSRLIFSEGL